MSYTGLSGLSATLVARTAFQVRELQRVGPGPWVWVGTFPGDTFTRAESPPWQNSYDSVAGARVRYRWGLDGQSDWDGVFDLTLGAVSGDVAFNVGDNPAGNDEFVGESVIGFIPLELAVGVWSAAVFKLYGVDESPYVAGDAVVFWPIVADPIP